MKKIQILLLLLLPFLGNTQPIIDKAQVPNITPDKISQSSYNTLGNIPVPNGVYYPVLTSQGLSSTTGLANHASGGVVASVAGTAGSGSIWLNRPIDPTKPFRCAVLIEINDAQPISNFQFTDVAGDFYAGARITSASTASISGDWGGTNWANAYGFTGGISAGTKFWIGLAGDGTNVTFFFIPANVTPNAFSFDNIPGFQVAYTNNAFSATVPITTTSSGHKIFGGTGADAQYRLSRIAISNKSTLNRIIGVYCAQSLTGPSDGQLQPPFMMKLTTGIYQDQTGWIVCPGQQGYLPTDVVLMAHPNASNGYSNIFTVAFTAATIPTQLANLYQNGYITTGLLGSASTSGFTNATASNWGAPAGIRYRKALYDYIKTNLSTTRNVFSLGQSMGGLNSLVMPVQYPGSIKAVAMVSGVCDLGDSYTNRGFSATIQKAYSNWYLNISAATGINPAQVVTATATAAISATSITVSALSAAIPTGTILTFQSGTGQATVVLTAPASSGATSITVTALTVAVNNGAVYNMTNYWTLIASSFSAPDDIYYQSPYTWLDLYVAATAYVANNVIAVQPAITVAQLNSFDPQLNYYSLIKTPIIDLHGNADATIPIAQAINLATSINGKGGNMTVYSFNINVASATSGATTLNITISAPTGTSLIPNLNIPVGTTLTLVTGTGPATVTTTTAITNSSTTVGVSAIGSSMTSWVGSVGHIDGSLYDGQTIANFFKVNQ